MEGGEHPSGADCGSSSSRVKMVQVINQVTDGRVGTRAGDHSFGELSVVYS